MQKFHDYKSMRFIILFFYLLIFKSNAISGIALISTYETKTCKPKAHQTLRCLRNTGIEIFSIGISKRTQHNQITEKWHSAFDINYIVDLGGSCDYYLDAGEFQMLPANVQAENIMKDMEKYPFSRIWIFVWEPQIFVTCLYLETLLRTFSDKGVKAGIMSDYERWEDTFGSQKACPALRVYDLWIHSSVEEGINIMFGSWRKAERTSFIVNGTQIICGCQELPFKLTNQIMSA